LPEPGARTFELVAGASSLAVATIFVFQEVVLRLAPEPSTTEELLAAPAAPIEKLRMALMFGLFFLSLITYAGVAFRSGNDAAKAGLVFATIACAIELAYRSVEMVAVPQWAEAHRHATDATVRTLLRGRVEVFQDVTTALYAVIRGAAMLTSACFGAALWRAAGLGRAISILFFVNLVRLGLNYLRPSVALLGPILDWVFIAVLAPLYASLGLWLLRSSGRPSSGSR
jgi:hypothetical protein